MKINIASLCSLAMLLWGIHTHWIIVAMPMILVLEGRWLVKWRWTLSLHHLKTLLNWCGGMVVLLLAFLLVTQRSFTVVYLILQWLPVCIFPLVIAQTYTTDFSSLLQSFLQKGAQQKQNSISLYYPYFALCLLSASAKNGDGVILYLATAILIAGLFWKLRPQRSFPILWLCLMVVAGGIGFLGHLQLHQLHVKLEQQAVPWLSGLSGESVDAYQSNTRIGSIGTLKQSNQIVFRMAADDHVRFPLLLQEAIYNKYNAAAWVAVKSKFAPIQSNADQTTWTLGKKSTDTLSLKILTALNQGQNVLKLPNGTSIIQDLPVEQMRKNQYGTVKVSGHPGPIAYQVQFNPAQSSDSPPSADDLLVPDAEQSAIEQTLSTFHLKGKSQSEVLDQITAFFQKDFRYSLKSSQFTPASTPLSSFLLKNRSGHCEYFATATTLLLRGAGIPARYVIGYSVHEFSPLEKQYVVRSRNAHAWSMVYVNGSWRSIDTTPPDWTAQEDADASPLQVLSDLWAFVGFQFAKGEVWVYVGWAIVPVCGFFLWKWRHKFPVQRILLPKKNSPQPTPEFIKEGLDSEFYLIEQRLAELGLNRTSAESWQQWMVRSEKQLSMSQMDVLRSILNLHYRYRFDPQGLGSMERERLRSLSQSWLSQYPVKVNP
jgi:protein-glutamine gamma-glutamyltransferase